MKIFKSIIFTFLITLILTKYHNVVASNVKSFSYKIQYINNKFKKTQESKNKITTSNEVIIGKQVWMTRNLNVDKFRNGDPIPYAKTPEEWKKAADNKQPAWCYYDMEKYGKLYNWYAVNDPRGLAPKGWKIPNDEDWIVLTDYLGGGRIAGGKMKSIGTKYWKGWEEEKKNEISRNKYATNESGFSGLPGGTRNISYFQGVGRDAYWWSATECDNYNATYLSINHLSRELEKYKENKLIGNSVRCLRESNEEEEEIIVDYPKTNEIKIGKQVWMTKNLNVENFSNGDPIPYAENQEEWKSASTKGKPAWCYYGFDKNKGKILGKLYNWHAVNDPRGLAPEGWHIPSDSEWTLLADFLGGKLIAGEKMKSKSSIWGNNGSGTNESGFTGLPGGCINEYGGFNYYGNYGIWWSSNAEDVDAINDAWYFTLSKSRDSFEKGDYNKSFGLSIRCIKN